MAQEDRIDTPMIALVGTLSVVLLFAIIVGLQVLYYQMTDGELARKDSRIASPELAAELTRQRERIEAYRWVDESKGVVAIPIGRAMDLVVREKARPAAAPAAEEAPGAR